MKKLLHTTIIEDVDFYTQCLMFFNLSQDFAVTEQQVFLTTNLNWRSSKVWQQNLVTCLDRNRNEFASSSIADTWTRGNDGAFVKLFLVFFWDVNPQAGLGGSLDSLNQDSVKQRLQVVNRLQKRLDVSTCLK